MKTLLAALAASLLLASPASAAQPEPTDKNPAVFAVNMALRLGVCVLGECAIRYEVDGVTVAKAQDFSDWQDCYVWVGYKGSFIYEAAGCAP